MRLLNLLLVLWLSSCTFEVTTEKSCAGELTPADFNGSMEGEWDVVMAKLPRGTSAVHVAFQAPEGDGLTVGVLSYERWSQGQLIAEREGLVSAGSIEVFVLGVPVNTGPLELVVINQSGGRGHRVFGALVICD